MSSILIEIDLCPAEKGVVSEVIAQEGRHCPSSGHHVISTLDTLHFTPPPPAYHEYLRLTLSVSNKSLLTKTEEQPVKSHECDFCRNHCLRCSPSMDVFHLQRRGTWKLHIFLQSKPLSRLVGDPSHHCSHCMPGNIQEQSTCPFWQLLAEERTAFGSQRD